MFKKFLALTSIFLAPLCSNGQINISDFNYCTYSFTKKKTFKWERQILPLSLILSGTALTLSSIKEDFQKNIQKGNLPLDDYIQYVPIAQLYLGDTLGIKSKNTLWNKTKYLIISELITSAITHSVKHFTGIKRPNGNPYAFPSGHTSQSFAAATVLYQEFKHAQTYWAYSGYAFALTTGILRVTNYKHWISDFLAGAGLGMLVTNLVYYFEPLKNWNPFKLGQEPRLALLSHLRWNSNEISIGLIMQL